MMLRALDLLFTVVHTGVIVFVVVGWMHPRTRPANLVLVLLTALMWCIVGPLYASFGYCPLTDWHFDVLRELGERDLPSSYVKYLADRWTGRDWDATLVDALTIGGGAVSLVASVTLSLRDRRRAKRHQAQADPADGADVL
jgi:hypothetical protein